MFVNFITCFVHYVVVFFFLFCFLFLLLRLLCVAWEVVWSIKVCSVLIWSDKMSGIDENIKLSEFKIPKGRICYKIPTNHQTNNMQIWGIKDHLLRHYNEQFKCRKQMLWGLIICMLGKICSGKHFEIVFLFFPENKIWHFVHIVSLGDNLHGMSNQVFWEK